MDTIEQFYRDHARSVFALLMARVRDRSLAEDLMQETFIKATRSLTGFRGGNPRSWLFTIARSVMIDHSRKRSPEPAEPVDEPAPPDPDAEERDLIGAVLARLPARQQAALLLVDQGGLSYAEMSEEVGVSLEAARTLLHRARTNFRSIYQELS